jgi:transcriptional regulator with XRE-family HTH domain
MLVIDFGGQGVSNKTISRWETGNYMPPVECLSILSDIYNISINEILAGERASGEDFTIIAEKNITSTLEELEKEGKKFENRMILILVITTVLAIIVNIILPMESLKDILVLVLVDAIVFIANTLNMVAVAAKKDSLGQ